MAACRRCPRRPRRPRALRRTRPSSRPSKRGGCRASAPKRCSAWRTCTAPASRRPRPACASRRPSGLATWSMRRAHTSGPLGCSTFLPCRRLRPARASSWRRTEVCCRKAPMRRRHSWQRHTRRRSLRTPCGPLSPSLQTGRREAASGTASSSTARSEPKSRRGSWTPFGPSFVWASPCFAVANGAKQSSGWMAPCVVRQKAGYRLQARRR
mmetsp:Transcript_52329/g.152104  ORF Transcript_52329/g.152104 Transcript_52329/m.152104 type:complete len:211 (+) Transcript_52329:731-1363(+)